MSLEEKPSRRENPSMRAHLKSIVEDTLRMEESSDLTWLPDGLVWVSASVPTGHVFVGSLTSDIGTSVFSVEFVENLH
jgi:hypothetical protein